MAPTSVAASPPTTTQAPIWGQAAPASVSPGQVPSACHPDDPSTEVRMSPSSLVSLAHEVATHEPPGAQTRASTARALGLVVRLQSAPPSEVVQMPPAQAVTPGPPHWPYPATRPCMGSLKYAASGSTPAPAAPTVKISARTSFQMRPPSAVCQIPVPTTQQSFGWSQKTEANQPVAEFGGCAAATHCWRRPLLTQTCPPATGPREPTVMQKDPAQLTVHDPPEALDPNAANGGGCSGSVQAEPSVVVTTTPADWPVMPVAAHSVASTQLTPVR